VSYEGPYAHSLRRKLRTWFEENPGEFLTLDDMAAKFDCTRHQAERAMQFLRDGGVLKTAFVAFLNPERLRERYVR
jgi:Fic family protein